MSVLPPRPKSPPLNALRAFEAAARLGGFRQAAEELNVTAGAVAQHVKALEGWCGALLFERHAQGVSLSDLGRAVLPEFVAAFDGVSAASEALRIRAAPERISLATLPSVAQLLVPEWLPRLRAQLPGVEVSVTAMEAAPNLAREPYDLTVFFEEGPFDGGRVLFGEDALVPVCTPAVGATLHSVSDLADVPVLSDQFWPDDWRDWLAVAAPKGGVLVQGPSFSLFSVAVSEALNGGGVLMGHLSLVQHLLARGALVAPFETQVQIAPRLVLRGAEKGRAGRVGDVLEGVAKE